MSTVYGDVYKIQRATKSSRGQFMLLPIVKMDIFIHIFNLLQIS